MFTQNPWWKDFEKQMEYLENIPWINSGGCAIAALALYRWLKNQPNSEELDLKLVYVYSDSDDTSFILNSKYLKGESKTIASCDHCLVSIEGELYDCDGNQTWDYRHHFKHELTEDFIVKSIFESNHWSDFFNRKSWLPKIEKHFKTKIDPAY